MGEEVVRSALELLTTPPLDLQALNPEAARETAKARSWSRSPAVVGLGVAPKITNGVLLEDSITLKVYVEAKVARRDLDTLSVVPRQLKLPGIPGPVETDVEPIGRQSLQTLATRIRPARPGYSIGSVEPTTGTFGALVRRPGSSDLYLLSNAHILSKSGNADPGLAILQPGPDDHGRNPEDKFAELYDSVSFDFSDSYTNRCDAALARILNVADVSGIVALTGAITPGNVSASSLRRGQSVQKTGRTTGHTTGIIKDVDYRTFIPYPNRNGLYKSVGFRNQVLCERYTDGGDSGALVLDNRGSAIGLHWCGSTSSSVFSPIEYVLKEFDVLLVTAADLNADGSLKAI